MLRAAPDCAETQNTELWRDTTFLLNSKFYRSKMHVFSISLLRTTACFVASAAFLICGEAWAETEIDLGSRNTVSLETKVLWPKEYGLYLLLQKRAGRASELRRDGYDVGQPNQTTDDPNLLTFSVKIYEWGSGEDGLVFEQSNLLPSLMMAIGKKYGLEVASARLSTGRYRIEATPENTNHSLTDIPARLIFISALRGK
ncbi:hypothetical protein [Phaeobacter gallaeciensis]|uniref:hypothetical protein n=1 Tax=Phaeobacter gallaeciensis TaxID=60890 RepID=UPI000BBBC526|nr:hypothetical protein [Phaeobacter gallaeciensis]ATF16923.1 hypothetical protein PhaeoP129_00254 [Phaeobacter gallaeciensis]ATF21032.1 hypothetical protein PhaeoP128_00254 [Phaeobacter gallaeciensis]